MQRTDVANSLGNGLAYVKYTITFSDLAKSITTGANTLNLLNDPGGNAVNTVNFAIPQGGVVLFTRLNVTTPFTGGSVSALHLIVGTAATTNGFLTSTDILTAVITVDQFGSVTPMNVNTAQTVLLTFTSATQPPSVLTAGQLDLYFLYADTTTPTA